MQIIYLDIFTISSLLIRIFTSVCIFKHFITDVSWKKINIINIYHHGGYILVQKMESK